MKNILAVRILPQVGLILGLSLIAGLVFNLSLIQRYQAGEFEHGFLSQEDFPNITFISLVQAEDLFSTGALFLDSREREKFQQGRIFGALSIPFEGEHDPAVLDILDVARERTLVIYCDGSECRSSVNLAAALHDRGYADIRIFFGGWEEWLTAGLPIDNDQP
jgi:rhodanese-related sulfurtransferase